MLVEESIELAADQWQAFLDKKGRLQAKLIADLYEAGWFITAVLPRLLPGENHREI